MARPRHGIAPKTWPFVVDAPDAATAWSLLVTAVRSNGPRGLGDLLGAAPPGAGLLHVLDRRAWFPPGCRRITYFVPRPRWRHGQLLIDVRVQGEGTVAPYRMMRAILSQWADTPNRERLHTDAVTVQFSEARALIRVKSHGDVHLIRGVIQAPVWRYTGRPDLGDPFDDRMLFIDGTGWID